MANVEIVSALIDAKAIGRTLKLRSSAKSSIVVLQEMLCDLGFGSLLGDRRTRVDGDYGNKTKRAVAAFAKANGLAASGSSVTAPLGRLLLKRHAFLDEMHHMEDAIKNRRVLADLRKGSPNKVAITVLQTILHEHGYDREMNWARFGADGDYGRGTTAAVAAFGAAHGLMSDGGRVTLEMAKASLRDFVRFYGADLHSEDRKLVRESLTITDTAKHTIVSDATHKKKFRKFRRGHYTLGDVKTATFINDNRRMLNGQGMSDSALNVMLGVSENEGNIDAVNTWDNAIMTFGLFQWTVGVRGARGELPALLKKIKEADADAFERNYGRHGLGLWSGTDGITGHLVLNGQLLNTADEKEQLRHPKWCFYFWKSGHDPVVQAVSLNHAFSRISVFARSSGYQVNGHDIADIVTSEYGMALVLDNHVNRPGYIKSCLTKAMNAAGLAGTDPSAWGTAEERALLARYVVIRETHGRSPMTDARKRAAVTKRYVDRGIISDERFSFGS